jgi:hypothetical protein
MSAADESNVVAIQPIAERIKKKRKKIIGTDAKLWNQQISEKPMATFAMVGRDMMWLRRNDDQYFILDPVKMTGQTGTTVTFHDDLIVDSSEAVNLLNLNDVRLLFDTLLQVPSRLFKTLDIPWTAGICGHLEFLTVAPSPPQIVLVPVVSTQRMKDFISSGKKEQHTAKLQTPIGPRYWQRLAIPYFHHLDEFTFVLLSHSAIVYKVDASQKKMTLFIPCSARFSDQTTFSLGDNSEIKLDVESGRVKINGEDVVIIRGEHFFPEVGVRSRPLIKNRIPAGNIANYIVNINGKWERISGRFENSISVENNLMLTFTKVDKTLAFTQGGFPVDEVAFAKYGSNLTLRFDPGLLVSDVSLNDRVGVRLHSIGDGAIMCCGEEIRISPSASRVVLRDASILTIHFDPLAPWAELDGLPVTLIEFVFVGAAFHRWPQLLSDRLNQVRNTRVEQQAVVIDPPKAEAMHEHTARVFSETNRILRTDKEWNEFIYENLFEPADKIPLARLYPTQCRELVDIIDDPNLQFRCSIVDRAFTTFVNVQTSLYEWIYDDEVSERRLAKMWWSTPHSTRVRYLLLYLSTPAWKVYSQQYPPQTRDDYKSELFFFAKTSERDKEKARADSSTLEKKQANVDMSGFSDRETMPVFIGTRPNPLYNYDEAKLVALRLSLELQQ